MSQNFEQGWQTILPGDVAMRYPGHSVFQVDLVSSEDELATLQSRSRARELVVAGTLIGQAQKGPALAGLAAELQVAIDEQLGEATMQKLCALQTQSWRALWVWPMELSMSQPAVQDSIWLEFSLPAGAYATEFIRELERCYQT